MDGATPVNSDYSGCFLQSCNTLTQHIMGYTRGEVVTKLDASGMADGQMAGLCFFWKPVAQLGIVQTNGIRKIQFNNSGTNMVGLELKTGTRNVWFKAMIDDHAGSTFAWSLDGKNFESIGGRFQFSWTNYRGTRVGIYSYNNMAEHGFVGFDFFRYNYRLER